MTDHTPHSELDYDVANAVQGLKGCDAVFPYDADRAYWGLHRWAELLIAERQGLEEQLETLRREALKVVEVESTGVLPDFQPLADVLGFNPAKSP